MLDKIKQFFGAELNDDDHHGPQQLQLAAATLLIELSRADFKQQPQELAAISAALQKCFSLSDERLAQLIIMAEEESRQATGLYPFTSLIKDHYSLEQRFELIRMLWQVAIADGEISKYEDHLIGKISDLIYLPRSEFIRAKLEILGR